MTRLGRSRWSGARVPSPRITTRAPTSLLALAAACAAALLVRSRWANEVSPSAPSPQDPLAPSPSAVAPVRVTPRTSPPSTFTAESVRALRLEHAAFPELSAPGAVVYVPAGIDRTRRLDVLLVFHGWNGCALAVAAPEPIPCHPDGPRRGALDLINQVRASGRAVVLVIPQLAMEATRGDAGRLGQDGGLRRFLAEVLAAIEPEVGAQRLEDLGRVLFAVHSGGYEAALAALQRGGVDVGHIAMFDGLYTGVPQIGAWLEPSLRAGDGTRRFVSVYGASAAAAGSRELDRQLRERGLAGGVRRRSTPGDVTLEESLASVALLRGFGDHQQVLRRNLAMVLRGAGLGARRP